MVFLNPSPVNSAADLDGDLTRRNRALAAGYASNFFVLNPAVNAVTVYDSGAYSDYHALQLDLRRRLAQGLSFSVNYQYAIEGGSAFLGFDYGRMMIRGRERAAMPSRRSGTGRFRSAAASATAPT